MKVKITEAQLKLVVEQSLYYGDERLPELIKEISDDIERAKKVCSKFYSTFKNVNINDIIDNPSIHLETIGKMENINKTYSDKSNKFYNILNTFEMDYDNDILIKFDKLNSDLDTIQNDMDSLVMMYREMVEMVIDDNGRLLNKFEYYNKQYPPNSIDIQGV